MATMHKLNLPARTLAELNARNRADLLAGLEIARNADPLNEPKVCRLLRLHLMNQGHYLDHNFETAYCIQPNSPVRFAESLFVMRDENGQPLKSMDVVRTLETHRKDLRLGSRFLFWLGFTAAEKFFGAPSSATEAFTHLSINTPPELATSPYFTARMEHGVDLLQRDYPGKGLMIEMLEQQPWNDGQRPCMATLRKCNVAFAVDDYGAPDGRHTPKSLKMARYYSNPGIPPLVKIDGGLTTQCLESGNFKPLTDRLAEVQEHVPNAELVFEWVQNADEVALITRHMQETGIHMPISFVQSRGFNAVEQKKALGWRPML